MTLDIAALRGEIRRKSTTPARLLEIAALDPQLSRSVAQAKTTPPDVLDKLARSSDMPTRTRVAEHPSTALPTLLHLAGDPQWTVLKALTEHPNLPAEVLEKLSRHKRSTVRAAAVKMLLARGPLAQADWERLQRDPAEEVRMELAAYAGLDAAAVTAFLQDPAASVRYTILARSLGAYTHKLTRQSFPLPAPLTPAQVLPLLDDENADVRLYAVRVLERQKFDFLTLPLAQRERLALDADPTLASHILNLWPQWFAPSEAKSAAHILAELAQSPNEGLRIKALSLTEDARLLQAAAADPSEAVRAEVAARVRDLCALQGLAQDSSETVRLRLLSNPHAPRELLRQVAGSTPNFFSRSALFAHPNLTEADWQELLSDGGPVLAGGRIDFTGLYMQYRDTRPDVYLRIMDYLAHSQRADVLGQMLGYHMSPAAVVQLGQSIQQHAPQLLPRYKEKYGSAHR
ncbi:MAG: hypothetical protein Q4C89_12385 [Deinococcus sp.]|uniref:hypothetical protein n=1 Tax=Deinococcus sp. TaxID=47478 RepID=UPI0026DA72F9|nr:hypothetical protein [Deinococcus sp.]MDO4246814.1 hypothetical protein [Deinococcus sp.]